MRQFNICLCGLGTVGGQLFTALHDAKHRSLLEQRSGARLHLHTVSARRPREYPLDKYRYTSDVLEAVKDPEINIVIETIGEIKMALALARETLKRGKHLITANKDLLAKHGDELFILAKQFSASIRWEAAVGGGIPVVQALHAGLFGNRIESIQGIINGTSNYVLSAMDEQKKDFDTALREAQDQGYAEANPDVDVNGMDAAHKLLLLAAIAWNVPLKGISPVRTKSIQQIQLEDINCAREFGYVIKPLAQASKNSADKVVLQVQPALVPNQNMLAKVHGAGNAVLIEGHMTGATFYIGPGAGGAPTCSALLADLGALVRGEGAGWMGSQHLPIGEFASKTDTGFENMHYLRFSVIDKAGVLSEITRATSKCGIGVEQVWQGDSAQQKNPAEHSNQGNPISVGFITKACHEKRIDDLLQQLQGKEFMCASPTHLHVQSPA